LLMLSKLEYALIIIMSALIASATAATIYAAVLIYRIRSECIDVEQIVNNLLSTQ